MNTNDKRKQTVLHDKNKLLGRYQSLYPVADRLLKKMLLAIKNTVHLVAPPFYKARIKDFTTYYKKVLHHKNGTTLPPGIGDALPLLGDLIGIRVVCVFLEDLSDVVEQLSGVFDVVEIEDKGANQKVTEFLYESIHLTVKMPQEIIDEVLSEMNAPETTYAEIQNMTAEIQIRTILQDAWAEVEHELVYKSEFSPFDLPMRRKLASINASLNLADIVFQELRDYQNKLNAEIEMRRLSFYHQADKETGLNEDVSLPQEKLPAATVPPSPFVRGTIDDLLLVAIKSHNQGDYETAIGLYTRIINFDPPPPSVALSVIYKHRGMAHFSRHDYGKALEDFTHSLASNPQNFQTQYYSGIVRSLQGDESGALECFTKSLIISPFQAHVHYRKALAEYNLGQYGDALSSLEECRKLGLDDTDVRKLHGKLMEKFDMKV